MRRRAGDPALPAASRVPGEIPQGVYQRVDLAERVVHGQRQPDRGLETVAAQDGLRAAVAGQDSDARLSRAAPTSSRWQPSRTNVNAIAFSGAFPTILSPGRKLISRTA